MKTSVLYKVYCGKKGKFYTYKDKIKAENLFNIMFNQNYHTYIIKIENGCQEMIAEYK